LADPTFILLLMLILVCWLGGNLGAVVLSFLIGDPHREREVRLSPALHALTVDEASADARIVRLLAATRPPAVLLWLLLVAAAVLGPWKPA